MCLKLGQRTIRDAQVLDEFRPVLSPLPLGNISWNRDGSALQLTA